MPQDYIQTLLEVLSATKPKVKPVHPTLTYGAGGYFFNGKWFGSDKEGARRAVKNYYCGIEPLAADVDLEPLEAKSLISKL